MAKNQKNANQEELNANDIMKDKAFRRNLAQLDNLLSQANLNLYGTDRMSDVDTLNGKFQKILHNEINSLTHGDEADVTSFLNKLYSNDKKSGAILNTIDSQFNNMTSDEFQSMQGVLYQAYQNRLLEQSDLHEVASQLIELSEAILITRDAIISADVVEGRMSRTLKFDKTDDDNAKDMIPLVELSEKKFKLLEKIKNFIIPKALEYGEYYVYIIPYSKIFNDFVKNKYNNGQTKKMYKETTLYESVSASGKNNKSKKNDYIKSLYKEYKDSSSSKDEEEKFTEDLQNIMENIVICNDSVPLPIIEEGIGSIDEYMKEFVDDSGNFSFTEAKSSKNKKNNSSNSNLFNKIINDDVKDGVTFTDDKGQHKSDDFSDIKDCYIKLIDPTKIIPVKIMNQTIGYYYVQAEDITPLSGVISSTWYYAKFDDNNRQHTIIDSIAQRIIDCFDKEFLKNNLKFKETIVEAINYYNLNEKRIKFQFIPAEYIQDFKIDQDEDGNGQSMIKKSLFYAKLYLMLLLFKIMSVILYSNDQKVNYIKTSGIDKNVANKVQEIARTKQSRQINIYDLFDYTTLLNKVGNGTELYIPTGRSSERPIETEILSGQDVQLNTELMEMLKNSYILGTGVPAAIVNYLNEAEFAKVVEQNNTKFNGRVVNYQLDFNPSITEMYRKILRWSTNIPENLIENFEFSLQPPKTVASNAKAEAINSFNQLVDFIVPIIFGDPTQSTDEYINLKIQKFKQLYAQEQLPMLNMDKILELKAAAERECVEDRLRPNPDNGDNGDDGLDMDIGM